MNTRAQLEQAFETISRRDSVAGRSRQRAGLVRAMRVALRSMLTEGSSESHNQGEGCEGCLQPPASFGAPARGRRASQTASERDERHDQSAVKIPK